MFKLKLNLDAKWHKRLNIVFLLVIAGLIFSNLKPDDKVVIMDNDQAYSPSDGSGFQNEDRTDIDVKVYFCGESDEELRGEYRTIRNQGNVAGNIKATISELLAGPKDADLAPILPRKTNIINVYIDRYDICYLDFSKEIKENAMGGSSSELLIINGIAYTVAKNFPAIKKLQILVDGEEVDTIGGHINLRLPIELK